MNKQLVLIIVANLLIIVGLSGCIEDEQTIYAKRFIGEPDNFVNITENQIKHFPHLKEAILTNKSVYITDYDNEEAELRGVLDYFDTYYICYQNEYYEIHFTTT